MKLIEPRELKWYEECFYKIGNKVICKLCNQYDISSNSPGSMLYHLDKHQIGSWTDTGGGRRYEAPR